MHAQTTASMQQRQRATSGLPYTGLPRPHACAQPREGLGQDAAAAAHVQQVQTCGGG
jgi:hypothetical protein